MEPERLPETPQGRTLPDPWICRCTCQFPLYLYPFFGLGELSRCLGTCRVGGLGLVGCGATGGERHLDDDDDGFCFATFDHSSDTGLGLNGGSELEVKHSAPELSK